MVSNSEHKWADDLGNRGCSFHSAAGFCGFPALCWGAVVWEGGSSAELARGFGGESQLRAADGGPWLGLWVLWCSVLVTHPPTLVF